MCVCNVCMCVCVCVCVKYNYLKLTCQKKNNWNDWNCKTTTKLIYYAKSLQWDSIKNEFEIKSKQNGADQ